MLIVGVSESDVEAVLSSGVGPGLPAGERCPACSGELRPWGSYRRWVRRAGETLALRVRRARCRACEGTHALLPSFLCARRRDLAEAIFAALCQAAEGRGHRPIAEAASVPVTTARGWLRRLRANAEPLRAGFAALACELGASPARAPPQASALAWLLEAIGTAHRAVSERLGPAAAGPPAAFSCAACGEGLLANIGPPLAGDSTSARVAQTAPGEREGGTK